MPLFIVVILFQLASSKLVAAESANEFASFGIVTDLHYADADVLGTRHYRDSVPKFRAALAEFSTQDLGFLIELGDFKDIDVGLGCGTGRATQKCRDSALGFLSTVEAMMEESFPGPRFHVLGNHDVDVLNQSAFLESTPNSPLAAVGGPGFYSFGFPFQPTLDVDGRARQPALRFITLNGDFTASGLPWDDLNGKAVPGERWEDANLPKTQLEWLAAQLRQAAADAQRVIVFIHYRLDGGPGGPVGTGLGSHEVPNRAWVDDCTLSNAASVRALLEEVPGLVLATFSGHDHVPLPPYTHEAVGKPAYLTIRAMIEGAWPEHNSFSRVSIRTDCSVVVHGFGSGGYNVTIPPPHSGCSLDLPTLFV